jgi:hypothetical protein
VAREITDIYRDLVLWAVDNGPRDWKVLHINMELARDDDEIANSWVMRWSKRAVFKKYFQAEIPGIAKAEMRDLFIELNDASAKVGEPWTVCDFMAFASGKYEANYLYGAPPRLSGQLASGT